MTLHLPRFPTVAETIHYVTTQQGPFGETITTCCAALISQVLELDVNNDDWIIQATVFPPEGMPFREHVLLNTKPMMMDEIIGDTAHTMTNCPHTSPGISQQHPSK